MPKKSTSMPSFLPALWSSSIPTIPLFLKSPVILPSAFFFSIILLPNFVLTPSMNEFMYLLSIGRTTTLIVYPLSPMAQFKSSQFPKCGVSITTPFPFLIPRQYVQGPQRLRFLRYSLYLFFSTLQIQRRPSPCSCKKKAQQSAPPPLFFLFRMPSLCYSPRALFPSYAP